VTHLWCDHEQVKTLIAEKVIPILRLSNLVLILFFPSNAVLATPLSFEVEEWR
jgi:hypothetical protein